MATEVVHLVAASGGSYTSIAAWQTAQVRNLVTANEIAVAEVRGILDQGSTPVTITGWTSDATRYVIIRAESGQSAMGRYLADGYAKITCASPTPVISVSTSYARLQNICVENTTNVNGGSAFTLNSDYSMAVGCTAVSNSTVASPNGAAIQMNGNTTGIEARSCIGILLNTTTAPVFSGSSGTNGRYHKWLNCTAVGNGTSTGLQHVTSSNPTADFWPVVINCVTYRCGTDYNDASSNTRWHSSCRNNAGQTSNASLIPGTNSVTGINRDAFADLYYHVKSGSVLSGAGYNHGYFTTDGFGRTISSWPIGFNDIVPETVHTVAASGGNYTTLSAWQTAQERNLVTADTNAVAQVSGTINGQLNTNPAWTTDLARRIIIRAAPGEEVKGRLSGSGFARVSHSTSGGSGMILDVPHVVVKDLYIENPNTNALRAIFCGGDYNVADGCTFATATNSSSSNRSCVEISGVATKAIKCAAVITGSSDQEAFSELNGNLDTGFFNCVAYNTDVGFRNNDLSDSTRWCKYINCVAVNAFDDYETVNNRFHSESRNNAGTSSSTANMPGSNAVVSVTFADFSGSTALTVSGSKLDGAGYNHDLFARDINGKVITSWPIGLNQPASTLTASGSLTSGASSVSSQATRRLTTTGSLGSQAATLAGSAVRSIIAQAVLDSSLSTLAGTANTDAGAIESSGTLVASDSAIAAIVSRVVTAQGSLGSPLAALSASSARELTSQATLSVIDAILAGSSARQVVASAASFEAGLSDLSSTATREVVATSSLLSGASSLTGTSTRTIVVSGSPVSGDANLAGLTTKVILATALFDSLDASLAAFASRVLTGSASLDADVADLQGLAVRGLTVSSALTSEEATLTGSVSRGVVGSGAIVSGSSTTSSLAARELTSTATLLSSESALSGLVALSGNFVAYGSLASSPATMTGSVSKSLVVSATLESSDAAVSATTTREVTSAATLSANEALLTAQAARNLVAQAFLQTSDASLVGLASDSLNIALSASFGLMAGFATIERKASVALAAQFSTLTGEATTAITVLTGPVQWYTASSAQRRFSADLVNRFVVEPIWQRKFKAALTKTFNSGSYQRLFSAL